MSRSERRQYQRMMKGAEMDPLAPRRSGRPGRPATPRRTEGPARAAGGRSGTPAAAASRREEEGEADARPLTARFVIRSVLIAALVGYLAFSLAWPNMPLALYVGAAVGVVALMVVLASRRVQFRMPQPPPG